jgi:hypothetical protein
MPWSSMIRLARCVCSSACAVCTAQFCCREVLSLLTTVPYRDSRYRVWDSAVSCTYQNSMLLNEAEEINGVLYTVERRVEEVADKSSLAPKELLRLKNSGPGSSGQDDW